jgi:hypothetical protein
MAVGVVGTATPAAAYIDDTGPDLSVTVTSSPVSQVQSGGNLSYTLTVRNTTSTYRECIESPYPGKPPKCFTYTAGGPVSNVVVRDSLPAGASFQSASGNSGFVCSSWAGVVTCSGGALAANGTASIVVNATAPQLAPGSAAQLLTNLAEVNPSQAIAERTYANNAASVQVTALPPVAIADLVVTGLSGPASVQRGGQATFTMTVQNQGTATVSNVSTVLDGGNSGWEIAASSGTAGFTPCFSPPERFSLRAWCPGFGYGTLAPGAIATINVTVQLPGVGGSYTMNATVDPYNYVAESNESNNQRTLAIVVN